MDWKEELKKISVGYQIDRSSFRRKEFIAFNEEVLIDFIEKLLVSRVELPVKPANDEIDIVKRDIMTLFVDISQQLAKCPYGKPRRLLLYMQEKVGNILNENDLGDKLMAKIKLNSWMVGLGIITTRYRVVVPTIQLNYQVINFLAEGE